MDVRFAAPDENFEKAKALIEKAAGGSPDLIVLPEMWNTGFFPKEGLGELADNDLHRVKCEIGALAGKYGINIAAGSVANARDGKVFNTAVVFDRSGKVIAEYDKTHLFTPMGEDLFFEKGLHLANFMIDSIPSSLAICYDLRFPELARTIALGGARLLIVAAQWPDVRIHHMTALARARAIENQMFVVCANACGRSGDTVFAGASAIYGPSGETLVFADGRECIISAEADLSMLCDIRCGIDVFADRRRDLYKC